MKEQIQAIVAGDLPKVFDSRRTQIGLQHLAAGRRVEPFEHRRIGDRPEIVDPNAAGNSHFFAAPCPPFDRRTGSSGIIGRKRERLGQFVAAAAQLHDKAAGGQRARLLDLADFIACPHKGAKWAVSVFRRRQPSRPGVVSIRCDVQRQPLRPRGRTNHRRPRQKQHQYRSQTSREVAHGRLLSVAGSRSDALRAATPMLAESCVEFQLAR